MFPHADIGIGIAVVWARMRFEHVPLNSTEPVWGEGELLLPVSLLAAVFQVLSLGVKRGTRDFSIPVLRALISVRLVMTVAYPHLRCPLTRMTASIEHQSLR